MNDLLLKLPIAGHYTESAQAMIHEGDCLDLLAQIPDKSVQLVVTSPPYNIGKAYEGKLDLKTYIANQAEVIRECVRTLSDTGSLCWQLGNYVKDGAIIPLDALLYPIFDDLGLVMRNRIVWHFEHGMHCKNRFSGRYETISWFTKNTKYYTFNLDPVRVPQKYPGKKHFRGPKVGQFSGNPLGKNPGDVWDIPNVKSNHVEKTEHPCQFPVELVERLVLSLTSENDLVLDPFLGVGSSVIAAVRHARRGIGAEIIPEYAAIAMQRTQAALNGTLRVRELGTPKYDPLKNNNNLTINPWAEQLAANPQNDAQLKLLQEIAGYKK